MCLPHIDLAWNRIDLVLPPRPRPPSISIPPLLLLLSPPLPFPPFLNFLAILVDLVQFLSYVF